MTTLKTNESKSVFEHVGELRRKIFIALGAFIVGAIITHLFHSEIIAFLLKPASGQKLIFLSPLEPLFFIFKIDFIGGFIISFPVIIWSLLSYITPALPEKISKHLFLIYISSTFLLIVALIYAFFITIPLSLRFLFSISISGIENNFSVEKYLSFFITQAVIIMGIFQVPVLIIEGVYIGLLKTKFLTNKRRYIYLVLLVALAVITPTTDVFSLSIVFIPCIVIFEISLWIGKIIERIRRKKQQSQ